MSLMSKGTATIANTEKPKKDNFRGDRPTNDITDIDGAKPFFKYSQYTRKPNSYDPQDIRGTQPKQLMRDTNAPDYTLYHDDIEGSKPKPSTFKQTRNVDPLNPDYKLASYKAAPAPEPKFLRETNAIDDIAGSRPKPRTKFMPRDTMNVGDIEGAASGWRPRHARVGREGAPRDVLRHEDITGGGFKSQRVTDPLRPEYTVNGMAVGDDPVKTRPKALPKGKNEPFYSLVTEDIEGARPGWRPPAEVFPPLSARRHWRNTNFVGDIDGAAPDTVAHAVRTERVVNPLNPAYVGLDGEVLENPQTPLYRAPGVAEGRALAAAAEARARAGAGQWGGPAGAPPPPAAAAASSSSRGYTSRGHAAAAAAADRQYLSSAQKDAMIERLEQEVAQLRATTGGLSSRSGGGGGGGGGGASSSSRRGRPRELLSASARASPLPGGGHFSSSSSSARGPASGRASAPLGSAGSRLVGGGGGGGGGWGNQEERGGGGGGGGGAGAGGFVPPRPPRSALPPPSGRSYSSKKAPGTGQSSNSGLVLRSTSGQGRHSAQSERLILQSSNGQPRVALTPSERRAAQAAADEVEGVRGLM